MLLVAKANGFAAKLRAFREAKGYSQADLAELVGVRRGAIARYEAGENDPTWRIIQQLADALGVTPNDFIDGGE